MRLLTEQAKKDRIAARPAQIKRALEKRKTASTGPVAQYRINGASRRSQRFKYAPHVGKKQIAKQAA